MLSCMIQSTHLNLDLINSGNTKILYMILKPKFMKPKLKLVLVISISNVVYNI